VSKVRENNIGKISTIPFHVYSMHKYVSFPFMYTFVLSVLYNYDK